MNGDFGARFSELAMPTLGRSASVAAAVTFSLIHDFSALTPVNKVRFLLIAHIVLKTNESFLLALCARSHLAHRRPRCTTHRAGHVVELRLNAINVFVVIDFDSGVDAELRLFALYNRGQTPPASRDFAS